MTRTLHISGLKCLCAIPAQARGITYILYPMDMLGPWIESAAERYATTIVAISGMDWESAFSPWPAPGVPDPNDAFKGESPRFLRTLQDEVVPQVERALGIAPDVERSLVGVSMSGLFALWQWPQSKAFRNVACLSGSFWFEGFMQWFRNQSFADKSGRAFFLLGHQEPKTNVAAFRCVGENTEAIVAALRAQGVNTDFEWVAGNHYQHPLERLDIALRHLTSPTQKL